MEDILIAVTQLEYDKTHDCLGSAEAAGYCCFPAPASEAELAAMIRERGARHAILGTDHYSGDLYDALPSGGVLARLGVGFDGLDLSLATRHGLFCTNTPGVLDHAVAEFTIATILAVSRNLPQLAGDMSKGEWSPRLGNQVSGQSLAIIGCGSIGCEVAHLAAHGFGMRVIGCDQDIGKAESLVRDFGFEKVVADFGAAVRDADFVSLHIPATARTRHFINRERLSLLPANAWLINTARGSVVNEAALYASLQQGSIAGAALDVFEQEPYVPVSPDQDLRTLPNVVLTPHCASSTHQASELAARRCLQNIRLADTGRFDELDLLNPAVLG